jgi:hypothetical protein
VLLPLLLGLMLSGLPPADPDAPYPRVRASSPLVRSILADTAARSATVRDLLARLADSDVIVYVDFTLARQLPAARTVFVTRSLDVRYLRIGISATVPFFDVAPLLAHELQHAVEIAAEPAVIDDRGVRRLVSPHRPRAGRRALRNRSRARDRMDRPARAEGTT